MDDAGGTEALRASASQWSLAGDRQLLNLLQNIHQKIMSRCQETHSKLEEMVTALDNASVSLQNVNNRFMALSNSQFIESRVYDDDTEISTDTTDIKPEQPSQAAVEPVLPSLIAGVKIIQRLHTPAQILQDSDTDTEDEELLSTILIPNNMYSERRLPYIIGSNNWKSKRHAGLMSDGSDSNLSEEEGASFEQYSESDEEPIQQTRKIEPTVSSSSADLLCPVSSQAQAVAPPSVPRSPPPRSQSEVAADLARRLGGGTIPEPKTTEEETVKPAIPRQLYKPQPTAGRIFSDEPPPLESAQDSDVDYITNESDEDDDIFAEINRKAPYVDRNRGQTRSNNKALNIESKDSIFDGLNEVLNKAPQQVFTQQSPLFDDADDSELFMKNPPSEPLPKLKEPSDTKKPVGAISLFGSKQDAETIGAAILKRNRRKSSSSGDSNFDDTNSNQAASQKPVDIAKPKHAIVKNDANMYKREVVTQNVDKNNTKQVVLKEVKKDSEIPKERDIFDDLFAKSENKQKTVSKIDTKPTVNAKTKVDFFSDDIFDDIDDIFASDVVITKTEKKDNVKKSSLFDDVDDLFSEVAAEKVITRVIKNDKLFDSDNELFNDESSKITDIAEPKLHKIESNNAVENIYFTESDKLEEIDDELFSIKNSVIQHGKNVDNSLHAVESTKIDCENKRPQTVFDSDDELFSNKQISSKNNEDSKHHSVNIFKTESKALSDDDEDIFSTIKPPVANKTEPNTVKVKDEISNLLSDENKENNNSDNKDDSDNTMESDEWSDDDSSKKSKLTTDSFKTVLKETKIDTVMENPSLFSDDDDKMDYFITKSKDSKSLESSNSISEKEIIDSTRTVLVSDLQKKEIYKEARPPSSLCKNSEETSQIKNKTTTTKPDNNIYSDNYIENDNIKTQDQSLKTDSVKDTVTKLKEAKHSFLHKQQVPQSQNTKTDLDNKQNNLDNNKNVDNSNKFSEPQIPKCTQEADIFDDIFADQPPAFEKPKEKKKSQNINALFDDDSDDEALFLRKTDHFTDEKPNEFPENQEQLFTIFHDEPPAIDIDFVPKTIKPTVFESLSDPNPAETSPDKLDGVLHSRTEEAAKPIGKLKPLNFNININSLLPGASPKKGLKPSSNENSTPSSPDICNDLEETEPRIVQSVSFVSKPNSAVLDNKISKERAKIPVKRRPSTRRARKEAVRKSAIDFGDVTDGDNVKRKIQDDGYTDEIKTDATDTLPKEKAEEEDINAKVYLNDQTGEEANKITKDDSEIKTTPLTHVLNINDDDIYIFRDPSNSLKKDNAITDIEPQSSINTLGNVYKTTIKDDVISKKLNIIDDADDFFKDLAPKDNKPTRKPEPEKLAKRTNNKKKTSKSVFDDLSDDENLFGDAKSTQKNTSKSVFLNDSDEELFASGSTIKKNMVVPKKDHKKSLFDDGDDDDLFVDKIKTPKEKSKPANQVLRQDTASKSSQPVFADPLSLFGSDDDM